MRGKAKCDQSDPGHYDSRLLVNDSPDSVERARLPLLLPSPWQMSFGERAAVEGVLVQCKPQLAIELGTAEGGSLERIALHSEQVHTFDLLEPSLDRDAFPNVEFHIGDSHRLLPKLLDRLASAQRNVDFALVDGDHSADGVKQDIQDLLGSPAVGRTVILLHDTMNETVREGIERVPFEAYPKVAYVELDFVAGYMFREPALLHELWGGLGLVVVDAARRAYFSGSIRQDRYFETFELVRASRDTIIQRRFVDGSKATYASDRGCLVRDA
jgi:hypothetical protein